MKSIQFYGNWNKDNNFLGLNCIIISCNQKETLYMHLVVPYFNFLIFSFVLWNSCFPKKKKGILKQYGNP